MAAKWKRRREKHELEVAAGTRQKAKFTKFDLDSNGTVSEKELADAIDTWRGRARSDAMKTDELSDQQ